MLARGVGGDWYRRIGRHRPTPEIACWFTLPKPVLVPAVPDPVLVTIRSDAAWWLVTLIYVARFLLTLEADFLLP